jgi:hypothetical protein
MQKIQTGYESFSRRAEGVVLPSFKWYDGLIIQKNQMKTIAKKQKA